MILNNGIENPFIKKNQPKRNELNLYLESACELEDVNILDYWKLNSNKFPILSKIAKYYLCCLGSSVLSETAFKKSSSFLSKKRSKMSFNNLRNLMLVDDWIHNFDSPNVQGSEKEIAEILDENEQLEIELEKNEEEFFEDDDFLNKNFY